MNQSLTGLVATCLVLACSAALAHGDVKCDGGPKAEWRAQMELKKQLETDGWKVRQVKTEGDCYEVYGFNAQGERIEAFFHPRSFEKIQENKP